MTICLALLNLAHSEPLISFIEGEAYGAKSSSIVQLSELCGAIKTSFLQKGHRILQLPPSMARSMILGTTKLPEKGTSKAKTKVYCDWMIQKMNLGVTNNGLKTDQMDALVIAKAGSMELLKLHTKLLLMRLTDHKVLVKSRKGTYTMGRGKTKISFRNFEKLEEKTKELLILKYENEILQKGDL